MTLAVDLGRKATKQTNKTILLQQFALNDNWANFIQPSQEFSQGDPPQKQLKLNYTIKKHGCHGVLWLIAAMET